MSDEIVTKRCKACKAIKPISEFYKSTKTTDGFRSKCKLCYNAAVTAYAKTPAGKRSYLRRVRRYRATAKGKACYRRWNQGLKASIAARRYEKQHPNRLKATRTVRKAVVQGILPPVNTLTCSCGKQARHYHHHSYDQKYWLDVIAVCPQCHKKLHAISRPRDWQPSEKSNLQEFQLA